MKKGLFLTISLFTMLFATSCSDDGIPTGTSPEKVQKAVGTTRSIGVKTPKLAVYIQTKDINPLNMGEYYFTGTDEQVIDHVILFASYIHGTISTAKLYHNYTQTYILNNANTLVKPLQDKGIKVLLGLLGDYTGVGFANLSYTQRESFAQQVADCVATYGLDGVDFDEEFAQYGHIAGTLPPSGENFSLLVQRLRELMPDKLITAKYYGYAFNVNQAGKDALDYLWPNFGTDYDAPIGFPDSKWASMSIQYTQGYPSGWQIQSQADGYYDGYGAIMMFDLRDNDASKVMNYFAPYVWNGKTVSWTGTVYPKDY